MDGSAAYIIANLNVTDPIEYKRYADGFFPILYRHAGEFITYDDRSETLEGGTPLSGRVVMLKFPSDEHARRWYADPAYQKISQHRRAGTQLAFLVLVHGMDGAPQADGPATESP
jgi:uncharacterized protein (DUF1330 family)